MNCESINSYYCPRICEIKYEDEPVNSSTEFRARKKYNFRNDDDNFKSSWGFFNKSSSMYEVKNVNSPSATATAAAAAAAFVGGETRVTTTDRDDLLMDMYAADTSIMDDQSEYYEIKWRYPTRTPKTENSAYPKVNSTNTNNTYLMSGLSDYLSVANDTAGPTTKLPNVRQHHHHHHSHRMSNMSDNVNEISKNFSHFTRSSLENGVNLTKLKNNFNGNSINNKMFMIPVDVDKSGSAGSIYLEYINLISTPSYNEKYLTETIKLKPKERTFTMDPRSKVKSEPELAASIQEEPDQPVIKPTVKESSKKIHKKLQPKADKNKKPNNPEKLENSESVKTVQEPTRKTTKANETEKKSRRKNSQQPEVKEPIKKVLVETNVNMPIKSTTPQQPPLVRSSISPIPAPSVPTVEKRETPILARSEPRQAPNNVIHQRKKSVPKTSNIKVFKKKPDKEKSKKETEPTPKPSKPPPRPPVEFESEFNKITEFEMSLSSIQSEPDVATVRDETRLKIDEPLVEITPTPSHDDSDNRPKAAKLPINRPPPSQLPIIEPSTRQTNKRAKKNRVVNNNDQQEDLPDVDANDPTPVDDKPPQQDVEIEPMPSPVIDNEPPREEEPARDDDEPFEFKFNIEFLRQKSKSIDSVSSKTVPELKHVDDEPLPVPTEPEPVPTVEKPTRTKIDFGMFNFFNRQNKNQLVVLKEEEETNEEEEEMSPYSDDWLLKWCILKDLTTRQCEKAFQMFDLKRRGFLAGDQLLAAIESISKLNNLKLNYLFSVLKLCDAEPLKNGADLKLFSLIMALAARINHLDDDWFKNMLPSLDLSTVENKVFKAKHLWKVLSDARTRTIDMHDLMIEFEAGGVTAEHVQFAREKFSDKSEFDILDYLSYIPLFVYIHDRIVSNPLHQNADI